MNPEKKRRLEKKGWKIGGVEEFLGLTREETAYIDLKISLGESLNSMRDERNMTQIQLAKLLKTSQSRVAKMEAGDPSVSLDLLIRSLMTLGATRTDLARLIA